MKNISLFLIVLMALAFPVESFAADRAEIMLMPTRVVMDNSERSASVQLKNTGNATGQFSISLIDMTMKEDGAVVTLPEGTVEPYSAIPYLHISPKSVTIKPGESQTIRVLQKRNADLEPGEYRAHLRVKMENDNVEGSEAAEANPGAEASISVKANLVLIIPVIFRVGETSYDVSIASPLLKYDTNGQPKLDLVLQRQGNRSAMGDFSVKYKSSSGEEKLLTFFPGVPVYRSTDRRYVSIPLDVPEGTSLSSGSLEVTYSAQEQDGGQPLAQANLPLN